MKEKKAGDFVLAIWWFLFAVGFALILVAIFGETPHPRFWNSGRGTRSTADYFFVLGTIVLLLAIRALMQHAKRRASDKNKDK